MNKTQQLLKEREEKQLDEIRYEIEDFFDNGERRKDVYKYDDYKILAEIVEKRVKSFHATTISLLLTSLKEELKIMEQSLPNSKCRNAESEMFGRCFDCEKTKGYNSALSDISTLISETISNIQTK